MPGYNGGIGGDSENNGGNSYGGGYSGDSTNGYGGFNGYGGAGSGGMNSNMVANPQDQFNQWLAEYLQGGALPNGQGIAPQFDNLDQANQYGYNQASTLYNQGPTQQDFGANTQQANSMIANMAQQNNPYITGALNTTQSQMTNENPFLQGFGAFQNMQNDQLGNMYDQGARKIQDSLNSQFGASGRTGSNYHANATGQALGDFSANLYGNAFDNMQNRNLSALQGGANTYYNQNNQQLNAAGMIPQLSQARYYDPLMLQGVGQTQDAQSQKMADSGWSNLQKYMDIVQGTRETPKEPKASTTDKLLGLGATVLPFVL